MATTLPEICPVYKDMNPECKRMLKAINKNPYNYCCGEKQGREGYGSVEPGYMGCPVFSRWFWEEVTRQAGKMSEALVKGGGSDAML